MDNIVAPALAATVDRLALVKAQLADLKAREDALKQELAATGLPFIDGTTHRVAISHCDPRPVIDWRAIAEKLNPSRQLVVAHTTVAEEGYIVVRVSARKAT
jgi:hypothetical protein